MNKFNVFILALASVGAAIVSGTSLEEVCKGKSPVELSTVGAIKPIIELAKANADSACSEVARQSILDLDPIIASDNVCSIEVATKIGEYYNKYLSGSGLLNRKPKIPASIKEYFLAVGSLVASKCKELFALEILDRTYERTKEYERELVAFHDLGGKQLAEAVFGGDPQFQGLFLVTRLFGLYDDQKKCMPVFSSKRISPKPKFERINTEVINRCRNKFKPIYDKLITPLAILANVGFVHEQGKLESEFGYCFGGNFFKLWLKTVYICEIALSQEQYDKDGKKIHNDNLNNDELAELEKEYGVTFDEPADNRQEYNIGLRLLESDDLKSLELQVMVANFSDKRKEAKELREEQLKRFVETAKSFLQSDGHGIVSRVGLNEEDLKKIKHMSV